MPLSATKWRIEVPEKRRLAYEAGLPERFALDCDSCQRPHANGSCDDIAESEKSAEARVSRLRTAPLGRGQGKSIPPCCSDASEDLSEYTSADVHHVRQGPAAAEPAKGVLHRVLGGGVFPLQLSLSAWAYGVRPEIHIGL